MQWSCPDSNTDPDHLCLPNFFTFVLPKWKYSAPPNPKLNIEQSVLFLYLFFFSICNLYHSLYKDKSLLFWWRGWGKWHRERRWTVGRWQRWVQGECQMSDLQKSWRGQFQLLFKILKLSDVKMCQQQIFAHVCANIAYMRQYADMRIDAHRKKVAHGQVLVWQKLKNNAKCILQ